ncbi:hypothetical protein B0A52_05814 [Exophiala mesophila]|uniref:HECT-type E3 ubiquitin transferase n=1 Tax=Exophiala mesophila TaxID=212818 RepID=A0A438N2L5_EXOME|nr:hypothetical protein B0A52_05814 [Exophiala mesophila]
MHYAQPTSKSGTHDDHGPEPHDSKFSRASKISADLGFHVPDHFLSDIIPLPDPKLDYVAHHTQRDRRLRLLIRRYTNQIQYGCRNVNCATPTCLSYRKRNCASPLRRYTDVSARALACHLIDDFVKSGADARNGLCQNDPVVPWYEDPALSKKRRSNVERHVRLPSNASENGHASKPFPSSNTHRLKDTRRLSPLTEHPMRRSSQEDIVQAGRRLRNPDVSTGATRLTMDNALDPLSPSADGLKEPDASTLDTLRHAQSLDHDTILPPAKTKDLASFTQTLFDLLPLRMLNWLPSVKSMAPQQSLHSHEHTSSQSSIGGAEDKAPTHELKQADVDKTQPCKLQAKQHEFAPTTAACPPTYTLRNLEFGHLVWLQSFTQSSSSQGTYDRQVLPFLQQSLIYCLSDPERLVTTVKTLQATYGRSTLSARPDDLNQVEEVSQGDIDHTPGKDAFKPPLRRSLPTPWPAFKSSTRTEVKSLVKSLAHLDQLKQRDLVINSIFTALQYSYALPTWLQKGTRLSSPACSASGDRSPKPAKRFNLDNATKSASLDILHNILSEDIENPRPALKDIQVCELCLVALMTIASLITADNYWAHKFTFTQLRILRNKDRAHSHWPKLANRGPESYNTDVLRFAGLMIRSIDTFDDWNILRLLKAVMDVISHRLTISKWAAAVKGANLPKERKTTIVDLLVARLDRVALTDDESDYGDSLSWMGTAIVEMVRTVMLRIWDRKPVIQRAGSVSGALELLAAIYRARVSLNLDEQVFTMPFIADSFDDIAMPNDWLAFRPDTRQTHLLSFSFLFEPATLVKYFRAINVEIMRKSHEQATLVYTETRHFMSASSIPLYGGKEILSHLRPHMAKYFVLTIRRDDILKDAIDQIWHRERMELLRPLRVRLGQNEGEDGLDHGGVQQEFFRVVFAEALDKNLGMFTIDDTTRMAWFQPGCLEPLYSFEALGVLMSVAVYNGITIPVTFPLAFYRKLLNLKAKNLDHISDGWPELTKGLRTLLEWSDGDVGDVIARTYEFSYEVYGSTATIDLSRVGREDPWPPLQGGNGTSALKKRTKSTSFELPPPTNRFGPTPQPSPPHQCTLDTGLAPVSRTASLNLKGCGTPNSLEESDMPTSPQDDEAPLVTNANRDQYVLDYIYWLVHKSVAPQFTAFARGFYTCLDRNALSIFTPEALKLVIEGHSKIDINELERTATYDDFERDSEYMHWFWAIVRNMSPEQHKHLLEFVTASDRVPVNGLASVTFVIQKNGDGDVDGRLPSSSTCYGRLLLPVYKQRAVLEEKLTKAIENHVGFGIL